MASRTRDHGDAKKPTKNRINIFDDDISVDAAKNIIQFSTHGHDEDEDDEVNWDGTPSVKYSNSDDMSKSKHPVPDISDLAVPSAPRISHTPNPSSMSKSSSMHGGYANATLYSHNRSHSLTIDQKSKPKGPDELRPPFKELRESDKKGSANSLNSSNFSLADLDDAIDLNKKQISASDVEKMQQEIQTLRRSLLSAKRDRWVKLPVKDTLRRIMRGESFSLEMYRSLADKRDLLDSAVKTHDGNAITAAVLFFKKTTSSQIFTREIKQRPVAANHYLHYLKEHYDYNEYIETLCILGRTEEAAIFKFQLLLPTPDVTLKISKLNESLRSHFNADPALSSHASLVQEYIDLLERQRPIEDSDAKREASGQSQLFKDFPRKQSLMDTPVVTTLYYCCLYHFDLSENSLGSPAAIRKRHHISEKQFVWTSVGARAKLRQWRDIEAILTTKGWFGGTKLKAVIGFDKIVGILHKYNAPPDILAKYLAVMDDPEARINLAKKVNCHAAVVDTYVALKDRASLQDYASKLDRYSKEGLYAHDALHGSVVKWK